MNKYMKIIEFIKEFLARIKNNYKVIILIIFVSLPIQYMVASYAVKNKIPRIAVIDLASLNSEFVTKVARYLADNQLSEEDLDTITQQYLQNLEVILKDINQKNYILLQKQMVVSEGIEDITQEVEKALFESIIKNIKKEKNAKN